jgi:hypothetical protein
MADDDLDVDRDDDLPASAPLGRLRQRVEQTRREAHVDCRIDVKDDDLSLLVRYKAVDLDTLEKINNRGKKRGFENDCALLIRACLGIFVDLGEQVVSVDSIDDPDAASAHIDTSDKIVGEPVTFSSDWLAAEFGVTSGKTVDVVRALFPFELQINQHARDVLQLSQGTTSDVREAALGN